MLVRRRALTLSSGITGLSNVEWNRGAQASSLVTGTGFFLFSGLLSGREENMECRRMYVIVCKIFS